MRPSTHEKSRCVNIRAGTGARLWGYSRFVVRAYGLAIGHFNLQEPSHFGQSRENWKSPSSRLRAFPTLRFAQFKVTLRVCRVQF